MSGCGNSGCSCGSACQCGGSCKCGSKRTMDINTIDTRVERFELENDCNCGANCNCSCPCHK